MNRRSLLQSLGGLLLGLFAPPVQAVRARFTRLLRHPPRWPHLEGPLWHHLETPEPVPSFNEGQAHVVCRVLRPAKAPRFDMRDHSAFCAAILHNRKTKLYPPDLVRLIVEGSALSPPSSDAILDWPGWKHPRLKPIYEDLMRKRFG